MGQGEAIAVSELADKNVYGAQGEQLGSINEVLIDRSGQQHAVIGRGGFLGLGEDQYIVPLEQLQMRGGNIYAPGLTQSQLRTMPRYRMGDQNYSIAQDQQQVQVRQAQ